MKVLLSFCATALLLAGCAHQNAGQGAAPGSVTGSANQKQGEYFPTETITPGVGSALFPDPGSR
jgi:hypothetical protein